MVHVPFARHGHPDRQAAHESALWLLGHMCEHLGLDDLASTDVLDYGCGGKFTEAILNNDLAIKHYTGVDVHREMIDYLRTEVDDPRFEYFHIDAHNAMYNPTGHKLTDDAIASLRGRTFDLICLFSVFTHLAPPDFLMLLRVLRRHVQPDGRLFFTLYVNEVTAGGWGFIDGWTKRLGGHKDEQISEEIRERLEAGLPAVPPFSDFDPRQPLKWAVYSEEHARSLVEEGGWSAVTLSPPGPFIQHHFVCAPSA